ncbi:MAG: Flp pilus assembly complex ATPase component [Proteobacteria bacterium]|nr:Flp pilus assembly complex ATPase component [Pseudomonadota bacterium]MCP4920398.1 Flp pilus assembly complex ATPase component [Pseudomonadota bacterium]
MAGPDDKNPTDKKRAVIEIDDDYGRDPMLDDEPAPHITMPSSGSPARDVTDAPSLPDLEASLGLNDPPTEEAERPGDPTIRVVADIASSKPDMDRIVRLLDSVAMLDPLGPELKRKLAPRLRVIDAAAGETIVHEGDPATAMYLITSGLVSVYRSDRDLGVTVELAKLGGGDNFGEMSLITGSPRSANVSAIEDTRLLLIDQQIFDRLVKAVPQVGLQIAGRLAHRIDELNQARGVTFDTLEGRTFDERLLQLVPVATIRRLRMLPLAEKQGVVEVATDQPHNRAGLLEIRRLLRGMQVRLIAVSQKDYANFLRTQVERVEGNDTRARLGFRQRVQQRAQRVDYDGTTSTQPNRGLTSAASSQEVSRLIDTMVVEAVDRDASDILIEPGREQLRIRFRIDGRLHEREGQVSLNLHMPIMSRLKVLASMDITERRLPQDGRIAMSIEKERYALRIATVNTRWGEKAVIRILDSSRLSASLSSLILHDRALEMLRRMVFQPGGLVLVTGPTGSGKTTTMYAAVMERHSPDVSICTVEDPVEYDLDGVTQVQVNDAIGLTFPHVMRAFLRQSPDIIMVGETRDRATADLTFNGALTGHQVLSSFHTTDAISTIPRLRDMGIERFVLSSALEGIVNQRLVRRICDQCRQPEEYSRVVIKQLNEGHVTVPRGGRMYIGRGCEACNGSGFSGRIGVYEVMMVGNQVRDAINSELPPDDLFRAAQYDGFITMADYASFLLGEGLTVPTEILRVLPMSREA